MIDRGLFEILWWAFMVFFGFSYSMSVWLDRKRSREWTACMKVFWFAMVLSMVMRWVL